VKRLALILLITFIAGTLAGCTGTKSQLPGAGAENSTVKETTDKATVSAAVTFDAIAEFVSAVGGERVFVTRLIPDGASAHHFEPKAKDLLALGEADVLFINGLNMEPWVENAVNAAGNPSLDVVDTSFGLDLILAADRPGAETDSEDGHDTHDHDHDHGTYDPHIWLGLSTAKQQVENIKDALTALDPEGTAVYRDNARAFTDSLDRLQSEYKDKFAALSRKDFVTGHAAFAYLCRDVGLNQNSVQNVFAEGEPSARELAELVDYCREKRVTTIFSETAANSEVARTLAEEVGAEVKLIYTMEQQEDNLNYLERMEKNLAMIYEALKGD
jgi:zinc transport system substrate-binding protein